MIPNPFTETSTLIFENRISENDVLKIFNLQGKVIEEYLNINGNEISIDRDRMQSGIYFFQLMNEKRIHSTGSLIIN